MEFSMTRLLNFFTLIVTALSATACAILPKNEVVTETHIPAKPEQVWSILTDGERYSEWNPFIINMQGSIEKGSQLKNTMKPFTGEQRIFKPTILEAKPNEELRWIGRVGLPGVFDGEHYFLLETEAGGTRFIHGEKFSGFALWFMDTDRFSENFEAMNVALSERVIFNFKNNIKP